jgi:hypothetical protein
MNAFANWYVGLSFSKAAIIWLVGMLIIGVICWFVTPYFASAEDRAAEREMRREWKAIRKRNRQKAKLLRQVRVTPKDFAKRCESGAFMSHRVGNDARRLGS